MQAEYINQDEYDFHIDFYMYYDFVYINFVMKKPCYFSHINKEKQSLK